ncbi:hypothetical protein LINPERPRIM_LOCUS6745, partial [Linum perenne]
KHRASSDDANRRCWWLPLLLAASRFQSRLKKSSAVVLTLLVNPSLDSAQSHSD